jgi:hypothetical protein
MKLKALLLACALAGFTASFALADDGGHDGHGKRHEHATTTMTTTNATTTPAGCARVELQGTFASVSASSFTLKVTKQNVDEDDNDNDDDDNNAANPAVANMVGQTVTIAVDANTRVSFKTTGMLTGPNVGDSARVDALSCGTPATLTAQSVKARGANTLKAQKSHR